jgi:heme/copper-type cytochrome/quinol oxidase subunit 2
MQPRVHPFVWTFAGALLACPLVMLAVFVSADGGITLMDDPASEPGDTATGFALGMIAVGVFALGVCLTLYFSWKRRQYSTDTR